VFRLVQELAADGYDIAVACRVLGVSRSGYYDWRNRPPCDRDVEDAYLANTIVDIHQMSRASYGAPRVHAELRLGMGVRVGRKRVARLLRMTGRRGISHRHKRRHRPAEAVHQDLVQRKFVAARPDLNHTPLTTNNVRRRLRAILDEAGIGGVTPHSFRRTVATVLDRAAGADLAAEMLGHTSSDITRAHYIEPDEFVNPVTADILESFAPRRDRGEPGR
jgi:integrase